MTHVRNGVGSDVRFDACGFCGWFVFVAGRYGVSDARNLCVRQFYREILRDYVLAIKFIHTARLRVSRCKQWMLLSDIDKNRYVEFPY